MGRGGRWQPGRERGPEGPGGRGWRPTGPPAPPAGQPKLDPKIIEQRRQNTASRLRRFLQPLRISPSLAGEEAMTEFNELMQVCLCDIVSISLSLLSKIPLSALFRKVLRANGVQNAPAQPCWYPVLGFAIISCRLAACPLLEMLGLLRRSHGTRYLQQPILLLTFSLPLLGVCCKGSIPFVQNCHRQHGRTMQG